MNIRSSKVCAGLQDTIENLVQGNPVLANSLEGLSFEMGLATEEGFQVPYHARNPVFVGDAAHITQGKVSAEVEALFKMNPNSVECFPKYNEATQNWEISMGKVGDSAYGQLAGQMYNPGMVSYFTEVFREPLSYSHAEKLVMDNTGTSPWATYMTMALRQFGGMAAAAGTGSSQNNMTNDVQVRDGLLTGQIVNLSATWAYTMEEIERNKSGSQSPFNNQGMSEKVPYANYVLKIMTDYLTYYGIDQTDVNGLLQINPVEAWAGPSLAEIRTGSSTNKGSDVYNAMAKVINDFLEPSDNKFNKIVIAMSPAAYNDFCTMPYSNVYDPTSAIRIFNENYNAGKGPDHERVTIEFISDPMLKANTIFNPDPADYMVITAPEIKAGPTEVSQKLVQRGMPIEKFVFPAIAGQYNTQYKMLRRCSGVFAPVKSAVKVYQGFGRK